jgi:hypothetical protein
MAGEENRVTVTIDAENDAGKAFAEATAEAEAFKKIMDDSNNSQLKSMRVSQDAWGAQRRAALAFRDALDEVRKGEELLAQYDNPNRRGGFWRTLFGGLSGGLSNLLSDLGGGSGGGGLLGGLAGLFGSGGIGAFFTSPGGIGAVIGVLLTGIQGIIPMIAAAAQGIVSFGVLAYPTLSKIASGFSAISSAAGKTARDKAWAAIPASLRPIEHQVLGIVRLFDRLSAKFLPHLTPVIGEGLKAAGQILHDLPAFADPAAKAIDSLLKSFNKFLASPGAAQFQREMAKLVGPSIKIIGEGIGQIAVAFGQLLMDLNNPNAKRAVRGFFTFIADSIKVLGGMFLGFGQLAVITFHGIAVAFDATRRAFANFGHNVAHHFDDLRHWVASFGHFWASQWDGARHTIATFGHDLASSFDAWRHLFASIGDFIAHFFTSDIPHWISVGVHWFEQLPGRIISALASLPGKLYQIGVNILQGLLHGLEAMGSNILGYVGNLAGSIISKIGGILGIGSPSRVMYQHGVWLAQGLANGMDAGRGMVAAAAGRLAGSALGAPGRGAAGGGLVVEINVPAGALVLGPEFFTALGNGIRIRGGDQRILTSKVVLA